MIENDSTNIIDFQYCHNARGIGLIDFDKEDLKDLFFSVNQVSSMPYINK